MKDIEKSTPQGQITIKTARLKQAERIILSENKLSPVSDTSSFFSGGFARFGIVLKRHSKAILFIQWLFVILYFSFLLSPVLLRHFAGEPLYENMADFSRLLFWGIGWPLIILSMMLSGRIWCGLFCPDGTLTELISHHGKKRSIPKWIRWKGWPCTVLAGTVLYGQLIGVYDHFPATLILLGIPTSLAIVSGYLYGNGKRIWCMYLCPGNGIFGLLARLSPFYYKVDRKRWEQFTAQTERLTCPTLINVRQMQGMSDCHACGRCIGYRNAVETGFRSPSSEILNTPENKISGSELFLLLWGVIGICTAALAWRGYVHYQDFPDLHLTMDCFSAGHLPWWLSANPSSLFLLLFIIFSGTILALTTYILLRLAALVSGKPHLWKPLALCMIPVTGFGIFLGISQISFTLWQSYGLHPEWKLAFQFIVLTAASLFSVRLGIKTIFGEISLTNLIALFIYCLPVALLFAIWAPYFLT